MSRRQRSAKEQAHRARLAREKALRRRTRTRRAATAAAAAVTLAGAGTAGAAAAPVPTGFARAALLDCSGATTPGSDPENLTDVDGTLFFTAFDGEHGNALWRSNGTADGTVLLKRLGGGEDYYDYGDTTLVGAGGTLFFTTEGDDGDELWRSDGTKAGTVLVKRFHDLDSDGYDDDGPSNMAAVGDTLFFTADDGTHGDELWRSDGTKAGTVLVKDIQKGEGGGYYDYSYGPSELTAVGDTLFFTADDGTHGQELWSSDGTKEGTVQVKNVYAGAYSSSPSNLTAVGEVLFFRARDGVNGRELWTSDGTKAGTTLVKNVRPGGASASPDELTAVGDTLFFNADDGTHGRDLWTSDGTEGGTVLVKDLGSVDEDYSYGASDLTAVGDTLFFNADDEVHGSELWRSDGTEAGTVLVKDIRPGDYDGYPSELTAVGDAVFFRARDGQHGRELWTSDGTAAGTTLVADINPGAGESRPQSLTASGGALFFSANDRVHGEELWTSDGTEAGTAMVEDINTGGAIDVSSRADLNTENGTARIRVYVDGSGTLVVTPVGERLIKRVVREVTSSDDSRINVTLEPTRAAKRELRRTGRLDVRAKFTFTSCGGAVNSVTKEYTLRMR